MRHTGDDVLSDDVAATVDPLRERERGAREIERAESVRRSQESVSRRPRLARESARAHDLMAGVDPQSSSEVGAGHIDRRERAVRAAQVAVGVIVGAAGFGHLAPAGGAHAHGALDRIGVSVLATRPLGGDRTWSTAFVWGADIEAGRLRHSLLVESSLDVDRHHVFFGRAEYVRRTGADLALIGSVSPALDIGAVSLGVMRKLVSVGSLETGVGAKGTVDIVPEELRLFYGSRTPVGVLAYLDVRR